MIYANTTSKHGTRFLAAVPLIQAARENFQIASENWPFPTEYRIGQCRDPYYAEIWQDGTDWQNTYWIIESIKYDGPKVKPFIYFDDEEGKFNKCDFSNLIEAMLWLRRDREWIQNGQNTIHDDDVWPFIKRDVKIPWTVKGNAVLVSCQMEHASQPKVNLKINLDFLPDKIARPVQEEQDYLSDIALKEHEKEVRRQLEKEEEDKKWQQQNK